MVGLTVAPAQAAGSCFPVAAHGVEVCGVWNGTVQNVNGSDYAKTSNFTWTVTRNDRQIKIRNVKVVVSGLSRCSAGPGWSGCDKIELDTREYDRAATGTTRTNPYWGSDKNGLVTGVNNYQRSNVKLQWGRGDGPWQSVTTGSIGQGKLW